MFNDEHSDLLQAVRSHEQTSVQEADVSPAASAQVTKLSSFPDLARLCVALKPLAVRAGKALDSTRIGVVSAGRAFALYEGG
eukprot:SAG31_NODE_10656_length_1113_cov_1.493097_1_plen_81_part_10